MSARTITDLWALEGRIAALRALRNAAFDAGDITAAEVLHKRLTDAETTLWIEGMG